MKVAVEWQLKMEVLYGEFNYRGVPPSSQQLFQGWVPLTPLDDYLAYVLLNLHWVSMVQCPVVIKTHIHGIYA